MKFHIISLQDLQEGRGGPSERMCLDQRKKERKQRKEISRVVVGVFPHEKRKKINNGGRQRGEWISKKERERPDVSMRAFSLHSLSAAATTTTASASGRAGVCVCVWGGGGEGGVGGNWTVLYIYGVHKSNTSISGAGRSRSISTKPSLSPTQTQPLPPPRHKKKGRNPSLEKRFSPN